MSECIGCFSRDIVAIRAEGAVCATCEVIGKYQGTEKLVEGKDRQRQARQAIQELQDHKMALERVREDFKELAQELETFITANTHLRQAIEDCLLTKEEMEEQWLQEAVEEHYAGLGQGFERFNV